MTEIWTWIAIFAILMIVGVIWRSITRPRYMKDEDYRALEEKNLHDWETWMENSQKEHPETGDESDNLRDSKKTKDNMVPNPEGNQQKEN